MDTHNNATYYCSLDKFFVCRYTNKILVKLLQIETINTMYSLKLLFAFDLKTSSVRAYLFRTKQFMI